MENIISQLSASLKEDNTESNRRNWAAYILENKIPIIDLVEIVLHDRPASLRFIWMIGSLCDLNPKTVEPAVPYFYSQLNKVNFPNFDRSLAKMFSLCGIPKANEAEVVDLLFKWILDPTITVSTKNYSLDALLKFSKNYPELKNELRLVIEDQLSKNSISFEKHSKRILEKL